MGYFNPSVVIGFCPMENRETFSPAKLLKVVFELMGVKIP